MNNVKILYYSFAYTYTCFRWKETYASKKTMGVNISACKDKSLPNLFQNHWLDSTYHSDHQRITVFLIRNENLFTLALLTRHVCSLQTMPSLQTFAKVECLIESQFMKLKYLVTCVGDICHRCRAFHSQLVYHYFTCIGYLHWCLCQCLCFM